MPGRITAEVIALVKERAALDDVVREHVTLRPAGSGSLKGLCPFHEEKTPSFTIRPALGTWHCFGCGEGGDVISFVVKLENLGFAEAVERLAGKVGVTVEYEEGGGRAGDAPGRRSRLLEAHRVAQEFFEEALFQPEARAGRDFLRARGFDGQVARHFGIGYSPQGGEALVRHLAAKGFTEEEIVLGGLGARGSRGLYDRFRGRLMWPIRVTAGDTVGFGARRLYEDDRIAAKYLNTADTPLYRKSTVLYGLDTARRAIAKDRMVVIVEGYTDVMACHLSGVQSAVATCGTAFGSEHVSVLRRIMRDEADLAPARVIFTFDGDDAGRKAALKAFEQEQRWSSQSYVAVAPDGMDPCELRQSRGEEALRALVDEAVPMFEFAIRAALARFDLDSPEGRVQALRAAAPVVANIRDRALRPQYVRALAGWLGSDVSEVTGEVNRASRVPPREVPVDRRAAADDASIEPTAEELRQALPAPDLRDPVVAAERQLLQCLLQFPDLLEPEVFLQLTPAMFVAPAHQAVAVGVVAAGPPEEHRTAAGWLDAVRAGAPTAVHPLLAELAVAPVPLRTDPGTARPYERDLDELVSRVRQTRLVRQVAEAMGRLQRLAGAADPDPAAQRTAALQLQELQRELATLRAHGGGS